MPELPESTYDQIVNRLKQEGRWHEKSPEESAEIFKKMDEEMDAFRFENQRKAKESEKEIALLVLTA